MLKKLIFCLSIILFVFLGGCSTVKQVPFECVKPCHANIDTTKNPTCFKQTVGDPKQCTLEERLEDICLKYFTCEKTGIGCNTVDNGYDSCVDCVKKCMEITDLSGRWDCRSQCYSKNP